MNRFARYSLAAVFLFAANAQDTKVNGEAERGKYIVENVAMCGHCHTPMNGAGQTDYSKRLQGAPFCNPFQDGRPTHRGLRVSRLGRTISSSACSPPGSHARVSRHASRCTSFT